MTVWEVLAFAYVLILLRAAWIAWTAVNQGAAAALEALGGEDQMLADLARPLPLHRRRRPVRDITPRTGTKSPHTEQVLHLDRDEYTVVER